MKDEEYIYKSDVREKAITARSARKTRTHCGKGGRARLPSDNLSKKELEAMNGEVKAYRLNDPMTKKEFKDLPNDLKVTYIKLLRSKYNIPDIHLGKAMGYSQQTFARIVNNLGLGNGKTSGKKKWDKDGFYAWWNGADSIPNQVIEEEPAEAQDEEPILEPVIISEEPEVFVEDDLPFEEPDPIQDAHHVALLAEIDALKIRIDELLKSNEELMAVREKDKAHIAWLEVRVDELGTERLMLEKQMDVVRLIFGGKNNGN